MCLKVSIHTCVCVMHKCVNMHIHSYIHERRRQWHPTPVLLPGKSHGRRSLVGCSPRAREESAMTERLYFHFSLSCIGEGNGNPLQCSCLENPRDGGAWWAAVSGVAQSRTGLKWLRSSSMWACVYIHVFVYMYRCICAVCIYICVHVVIFSPKAVIKLI